MRKIAIILQISLLLFFTFSFSNAEEKIRIGVSTVLTGDAATYGIDIKNVLQFANDKIANGKYELIFEDDRCTGKDSVAIAHRFVNVLNLKYVIGFACSSTVLSTANIYEKAGVLTMITVASAAEIANAGDYIFRTWPSDDKAALKLYEEAASKFKKIGIISEETDYAQAFLNSFLSANNDKKIEIINDNYLPETNDFRTLILKMKNENVDALFINSQSEASFLNVLQQVKSVAWEVQILSAYWSGTSAVLGKAAGLVENNIFVDLPSPEEALTEEGKKLFAEFKDKYGGLKSVDLIFGTAFEAFRALHMAIESGQETRKFLYQQKFNGVFGNWNFDENGEIKGLNFLMKEIKDGKPTRIS
ncbi:MAG: ABC transporter substrate-binding protein [Bdellovibrionales bacterium]|nr:ABC transporter substrate-binding protein [Bdellovibrionales bacterium]